MTTTVLNKLSLGVIVACSGLGIGCNTVLDIHAGRQTCGIHAPVCDDPNVAHWNPVTEKSYVVDDDTVCDEGTGLLWSRSPSDPQNHETAGDYCDGLSLDGLSGFRVPTRLELTSITDYTRGRPAIDVATFDAPPDRFWSATRSVGFETTLLYVDFDTGRVERQFLADMPDSLYRVRCVRRDGEDDASQCGDPTCINGRFCAHTGFVTDIETHLDWQAEVPQGPEGIPWDRAQTDCEELKLGDGPPWRLPRVEELQTLVKDTLEQNGEQNDGLAGDGAIDRDAFTTTMPLTYYWTSSEFTADPARDKAWTVSFVDGALFEFPKGQTEDTGTGFAARCVRNAQ